MEKEDFDQWCLLLKEAKRLGLTIEQIRDFLQKKVVKNQ